MVINHLTDEQKEKGIIAASAGNHAQGVALTAKLLGINATIVMPETAPMDERLSYHFLSLILPYKV
jgi:threonine dehydratase